MTLIIELTPIQEARLEVAAHASGTSAKGYVTRLVEEHLLAVESDAEVPLGTLTLADTLAGRTGRLHSGRKRGEKSVADMHPLAQFAGAFADDPIFAQVKEAISDKRRRDNMRPK